MDRNLIFKTFAVATFTLAVLIIAFLPVSHRGGDCTSVLECTVFFANSQFFTAIIGSFAGALAGAWIAQLIAERSKLRDELLKEIRATNAALSLTYTAVNSAIVLKKQHVKGLKENYESLINEYKRLFGMKGPQTFNAQFDLRALPDAVSPAHALQDILVEKLSIPGRMIHVYSSFTQTLDGLNIAIRRRNEVIEAYKHVDTSTRITLVLGIENNAGRTDSTYPDLIDAIYTQTDWVISFGKLLCEDLASHGQTCASTFRQRFGDAAPRIQTVDFSKAEQLGLLPDPTELEALMSAFQHTEKS